MIAETLLKLAGPFHIVAGLLLFSTIVSPAASSVLISTFELPSNHPWSPVFVSFFGPTIASWGVLFTAIVRAYFAAPTQMLWKSMVASVLVWAILDTSLCVYVDLWHAAAVNSFVALILLTLLGLVRKRAFDD